MCPLWALYATPNGPLMNPTAIIQLLWSLTAFVASVTLLWVVYRTVHHAINTKFSFKYWVEDLSSVNTRMTVALGLFVLTIIVLLAAVVVNAGGVFRADLDKETIRYILLAEFGAMGWDVVGFIGKRVTFQPGSPDDTRNQDQPPPPVVVVPPPAAEPPVVAPQPDQLISSNLTNFTPRPAFVPTDKD